MSERISTAPLDTLAAITMGQSPESSAINGGESGLPFLQGCAEFGARIPTARVHCSTPLRVAKTGSTLISVRAPVGTTNRADRDYCIGRGLGSVLAKPGYADNAYLLNAIQHGVAYLHRRSQGSTFLAISSRELRSLPIPALDTSTQQRIAEILTTIDEAIEQTEALIAKTQQIKTGLMHDLLARGVTKNGELRPPRSEAPQLYKESPLGWIPKEWEISDLRDCLLENPTNGIYKPANLIGRGTLLVGQAGFTPERSIDYSLSRRAVVSSDELRRYGLTENNILVSRVFATVEGVGQPALVPLLPEPAVFESNMMRLRVDGAAILPGLLFAWLRDYRTRRTIIGRANASNQCSVNQSVLNPLPVLRPTLDEQAQLLCLLQAHDEWLATEQLEFRKLQQFKQGLTQDLLTGRVRVPTSVASSPA